MSSLNEPRVSRSLGLSGSWRNLRIDTMGPSTDSGSITTFRRPPSGRRASTMGLDSSSRRPSGARMRRTMRNTCWLSEKRTVSRASTPRRDTNTLSLPLMRMSSTSWSLSRSSSGPRPASSLVSAAYLAQLALVDGHPAQAHEAGHLDIHEFLDGGAGPAAELGAEFLDARQQVFVGLVLDVLEAFGRDEFAAARGAEFHGWRHDHDVCQLSTTLVKRCTPGSQLASQLLCRARGASLPASSRSTSVCTART